jgi:hypothetical protein
MAFLRDLPGDVADQSGERDKQEIFLSIEPHLSELGRQVYMSGRRGILILIKFDGRR